MRRQREMGMKGLGQVLKSFRDRSTDFSVYDRDSGTDSYLKTLGPLQMHDKGSRAGLSAADPRTALGHIEDQTHEAHNFALYKGRTGSD